MVIVTTAVYWGLNSPLHPCGLTGPLNLPAPGRRQSVYLDFTSSHGPVFLVNSRSSLVSATGSRSHRKGVHDIPVPLLPKLRGHFAEFLNHSYLVRLGMLYLTTCVGLGYGPCVCSLEAFLGSRGSPNSPQPAMRHLSGLVSDGFAYRSPYRLAPVLPLTGTATFLRHPFA